MDFSDIKTEHPFGLSLVTGFYKTFKFQFTEITLKTLLYDLNTWIKEANDTEQLEMERFKLGFFVPDEFANNIDEKILCNFRQ